MGKNSEHYVNNIEFCDALIVHRKNFFDWKDLLYLDYKIIQFVPQKNNIYNIIHLYYITSLYEYLLCAINSKPKVSKYLVTQIIKIATRFAQSPKYINRSYKEDMINNAVENCLRYITNFNPEITTNAFSYFTQCCYYAFLRTILSENKQRDVESKITEQSEFFAFFSSGENLEYHEKQQLKESLELRCRTEKQLEYRIKNAQ